MSIITISRGSKSGGLEIAERLAKRLDCESVSREILVKVAEDYGVAEKELNLAMEKPPRFWERSTQNRRLYLTFIRSALLEYAKNGCMVYHGHAGQFLLGDIDWVLKVRLIAPLERRVAIVMDSMGLNHDEAVQRIKKLDENRQRWTKFLYNEDWTDPSHFDIVVNLHTMTLETACDMISQLAMSPEFITTDERISEVADLALAARAEAVIANDPRTRGVDIKISVDRDSVMLEGYVEQEQLRTHIVNIVKEIEGVSTVRNGLITRRITPIPT